jgi:hypothetical protein
VRSEIGLAEGVAAPALATDGQSERLPLSAAEAKLCRVFAVGDRKTGGQSAEGLQAPHARRRAQIEIHPDLVPFEHALASDRDGDVDVHLASEQEAEANDGCERERQDDELGTAEDERRDEPEPGEAGIGAEPGGGGPTQSRTGTTSSAAGVGTVSSRSSTTSSARMRCTHSSGRSMRR